MDDLEVGRYALRTFKVRYDSGGYLGCLAVTGRQWFNGVCEAKCLADDPYFQGYLTPVKGEHEVPHKDCACGIYGSHSLDHLTGQYMGYASLMLAVIAAEGTTIIGSCGLRTQYARIVAWWAQDSHIQGICARECPDAKPYPTVNPMLNDFGLSRRASRSARVIHTDLPLGPEYWKRGE